MCKISYRRHRFPPVIIQHAVWLYCRFTLSYRDVEDLLAERGLDISYAMLLVTVGTLPPAAQTFDAAVEAYERGDYATALAGFQNYAEQGNATAQGQSSANEGKEHVAKYMTQSHVVKAQKLSREYWTRYVIPFQ